MSPKSGDDEDEDMQFEEKKEPVQTSQQKLEQKLERLKLEVKQLEQDEKKRIKAVEDQEKVIRSKTEERDKLDGEIVDVRQKEETAQNAFAGVFPQYAQPNDQSQLSSK